MFRYAVLILMVFLPLAVAALESSGGQAKEKNTSEKREFSTKPLQVYSTRGRKDPFLLPMMQPPVTDMDSISLMDLYFVGMMSVGHRQTALFRKVSGRELTFTLRDGYLYGLENKKVPGFKGKIINSAMVVLMKGEEKLTYTVEREKSNPYQ
jgi:hypothetical protein